MKHLRITPSYKTAKKAASPEEMEAQIAAIDPTPWRAQFDDDGDLVIWFHADLAANPRRIVVSLDEQPSDNELAAAALLIHCREYITQLIGRVRKLEQAAAGHQEIVERLQAEAR